MPQHSKIRSYWEILTLGFMLVWFVIVVSVSQVPGYVHSLLGLAVLSFIFFFKSWGGKNR